MSGGRSLKRWSIGLVAVLSVGPIGCGDSGEAGGSGREQIVGIYACRQAGGPVQNLAELAADGTVTIRGVDGDAGRSGTWSLDGAQGRFHVADEDMTFIVDDGYLEFGDGTDCGPAGGVDGPVMYGRAPSPDAELAFEMALIEGTVERERDCLYVRSLDDQTRSPLLWPHGTTWRDNPPAVVQTGRAVLRLGDRLSTAGGYHKIDSLVRDGLPPVVVARAELCAEGEDQELAVVGAYHEID